LFLRQPRRRAPRQTVSPDRRGRHGALSAHDHSLAKERLAEPLARWGHAMIQRFLAAYG